MTQTDYAKCPECGIKTIEYTYDEDQGPSHNLDDESCLCNHCYEAKEEMQAHIEAIGRDMLGNGDPNTDISVSFVTLKDTLWALADLWTVNDLRDAINQIEAEKYHMAPNIVAISNDNNS